ncbi:MAG: hypothetical protein R3B13_27235 [Polyangiaceae bacterium]
MRRIALVASAMLGTLATASAAAQSAAQPVELDRVVVRFSAPETGGVRAPRFIFERPLAFEARLEALSDPDHSPSAERPYRERHVRAALERHVAETLLASLRIDPEPSERELSRQTEAARKLLYERSGGRDAVDAAARAEGIADREVLRLLRRRARASLYLDRMVAPMLAPSRAELLVLHKHADTPFRNLPFERAEAPLARWYVGRRLSDALSNFFQNARARLELTVVAPD